MTKWILAAGAAALAIASPALADREGKGGGKGEQQAAKADKGGGGKANRGGGHQSVKADRGKGNQGFKVDHGGAKNDVRLSKSDDRGTKRDGKVRGHGDDRVWAKSKNRDDFRGRDDRLYGDLNGRFAGGLVNGCPPGLAQKLNGCLPPGQAKKLIGSRFPDAFERSFLPASYRNWYPDDDQYLYRMRDGYVYRIDRNGGLINGLFPLFENDGNFFTVGQRYPLDYGFYNVPMQYRSFYADNNDYLYRYGDGGIYQVNRSSGLIEGIAALLAGDFGVGQRMPLGYDTYNVPLAYRDQYYDTADNMYRYNDGYIYRVDPKTQLIQAVISALI
jgi:hypothetical protein